MIGLARVRTRVGMVDLVYNFIHYPVAPETKCARLTVMPAGNEISPAR